MYKRINHAKKNVVLPVAVIFCVCQAGVFGQERTCAVSLEPEPVREKQGEGLTDRDDGLLMCDADGRCGKLAFDNIRNAFPGAFRTQQDAEKGAKLPFNNYNKTDTSSCGQQSRKAVIASKTCGPFWSDRDRCCPTYPQHCRGRCTQQYTIQSMLAWCPGLPGIKMYHFKIPTYCSCQRVRRRG